MTHELKPVLEPYSPEVAAILRNYPTIDGKLLTLFRVFANSVRFLTKGVVNLLDKDSPLSMRQRELVILRITANNNCEYEWGVHVATFAGKVGFTEEQINATRLGDYTASCWSPDESLLIEVVDELCALARVADRTYSRFQRVWTAEQQLEILALCGNYHTICFVANTVRLDSEPFAARFPT